MRDPPRCFSLRHSGVKMGPKKEKEKPTGIVAVKQKIGLNVADDVVRNSRGGVEVSRAEIEAAFAFLDVEQKGKVTQANLKKRLTAFFPDLSARDYKYLMDQKKELVLDDLVEILAGNEIKEFDPVAEVDTITCTTAPPLLLTNVYNLVTPRHLLAPHQHQHQH